MASTRSFSNARREAQSLSKESRGLGMSPAPSFHIWAPKHAFGLLHDGSLRYCRAPEIRKWERSKGTGLSSRQM